MKTRFLILIMLFALVPTIASAQFYNRKKVAITEVVDKSGNISSATLTYVEEQLMEYILISEVTPLDKNTVLLSARIVNTSNGKIVASSSVRTYADIDYLRSACNTLASKLVGTI